MISTSSEIERFRAERGWLLREGNTATARAGELYRSDNDTDSDLARVQLDIRHDAVDQYRRLLPDIAVSRCPHTGELVSWAMDTVDLDGWFWKYRAQVRRDGYLPRTFLALAGAVRLYEPLTRAPFLAVPGPGVPYVVPRILDQTDTLAVIAQVPVGHHIGWSITYFGPRQPALRLVNDWGSNRHDSYDRDGNWLGWSQTPLDAIDDYAFDFDFELEPWIDTGKLRWIAPDDETLSIRHGLAGCPYTGLEGPREFARIEDGELWYGE
jgi:hypothetical protein